MLSHRKKYQLIALSFCIGIVLMLIKFTAWAFTKSNAILTDALESIVNVIASGFAFYSIYLASKPRDENHPYGHGKIEFFSAAIEGILIALAGVFIIYHSVLHLINPTELESLSIGMFLVFGTAVTNWLLGWYLEREGERYDSLTLIADGKHLILDAQSSVVLVIGVAVMYFTHWYTLDSVLSILFSFFIVYNGIKLVRKSVGGLMDEVDAETLEKVVTVLKNNQRDTWVDIHNLRVQKYGSDLHIDCHVTLPFYWTLEEVHKEVNGIEKILTTEFASQVEIFIHADPCLSACCHHCKLSKCIHRKFPQTKSIEWETQNLSLNQKHFLEALK
ncbi:MAG: cation diffusion facilitator family transporter [Spirosomataceae bacterium]